MLRLLTALLFASVLAVPATAEAGPLSRFRARLQQRHAPAPTVPHKQATPAPQADPEAPTPKVAQGAAPQVVGGPIRDRAKAELLRILAIRHAVEHGVPNGDGTTRKVTRAQARKLADQVTDEQLLKGATVYGAPVGEGRLEALFDWILEHREEIKELVKWIVSLFALFASDEEPTALHVVPIDRGGGAWGLVLAARGHA